MCATPEIQWPSHLADYPHKPIPIVEYETLKIILSFTKKYSVVVIYIYIYIYIKAEALTRCCHVRKKAHLKKWHV